MFSGICNQFDNLSFHQVLSMKGALKDIHFCITYCTHVFMDTPDISSPTSQLYCATALNKRGILMNIFISTKTLWVLIRSI